MKTLHPTAPQKDRQDQRRISLHTLLCGFGLLAALASTGCQITEGGQTLPSAYYIEDDVQYFAPGTEFKLSEEAAAQRAYRLEQQLQGF